MPSRKQDEDFAQMMAEDHVDVIKISKTALDGAIDWIINEFDPGDIYPDKKLADWAEANGYTKE